MPDTDHAKTVTRKQGGGNVVKYTVDRFEGDMAILERDSDLAMVEVLKTAIPDGVKEGDILLENEGAFTIQVEETREREASIKKLMDSLFED